MNSVSPRPDEKLLIRDILRSPVVLQVLPCRRVNARGFTVDYLFVKKEYVQLYEFYYETGSLEFVSEIYFPQKIRLLIPLTSRNEANVKTEQSDDLFSMPVFEDVSVADHCAVHTDDGAVHLLSFNDHCRQFQIEASLDSIELFEVGEAPYRLVQSVKESHVFSYSLDHQGKYVLFKGMESTSDFSEQYGNDIIDIGMLGCRVVNCCFLTTGSSNTVIIGALVLDQLAKLSLMISCWTLTDEKEPHRTSYHLPLSSRQNQSTFTMVPLQHHLENVVLISAHRISMVNVEQIASADLDFEQQPFDFGVSCAVSDTAWDTKEGCEYFYVSTESRAVVKVSCFTARLEMFHVGAIRSAGSVIQIISGESTGDYVFVSGDGCGHTLYEINDTVVTERQIFDNWSPVFDGVAVPTIGDQHALLLSSGVRRNGQLTHVTRVVPVKETKGEVELPGSTAVWQFKSSQSTILNVVGYPWTTQVLCFSDQDGLIDVTEESGLLRDETLAICSWNDIWVQICRGKYRVSPMLGSGRHDSYEAPLPERAICACVDRFVMCYEADARNLLVFDVADTTHGYDPTCIKPMDDISDSTLSFIQAFRAPDETSDPNNPERSSYSASKCYFIVAGFDNGWTVLIAFDPMNRSTTLFQLVTIQGRVPRSAHVSVEGKSIALYIGFYDGTLSLARLGHETASI